MKYRVVYARSFRAAVSDQVDYLRDQQVPDDVIEEWFDRLFALVDDLGDWPRWYALDERMTRELGFEIRKFVYARRVITYHVDDSRRRVELLGMVHGARRK